MAGCGIEPEEIWKEVEENNDYLISSKKLYKCYKG